ncbi:putative membrane protein YgcG [Thermocatellispora tengchongensis]|uniref:Putative membrane protein YgcG n=1 Tax=Thermocatellispora tengchongensis TaxID=1073253 RepID=A0A840P4G4_9ACTN|nr:hypothetical protein [Thermocatellispora tengchongensis]MBB5134252.1 putative membrane protein YgcG [Thermocatellispora tengchongensis]
MVGRAGTWGEATGRELIAALAVAQAARARPVVAELRRRDAAGLLPAEQFAAALRALAARGDRAPAAAALAWIAESAPARADASLPALALLVRHPVPAIRDRAVRLALRLAPHAGAEAGKAIREAAAQLPPEHRHPLTRAYGAQTLVPAPPVPAPRGPAEPPAPIGSPAGLARALRALRWPAEPAQVEPVLAALVELAARDRSSLAAALAEWRRAEWGERLDPRRYAFPTTAYDSDILALVRRCVLAAMSPHESRELTLALAGQHLPGEEAAGPDEFVRERLREIIRAYERGAEVAPLLATPPVTLASLVARLEDLAARGLEPLEHDLAQALLRLPREHDPAALARAARLTSPAGRVLAAWLAAPDPVVTCGLEIVARPDPETGEPSSVQEMHARVTCAAGGATGGAGGGGGGGATGGAGAGGLGEGGGGAVASAVGGPGGLPASVARLLFTLAPAPGLPGYSTSMAWWPHVMPSHREVVAAHLLECLPSVSGGDDGQTESLPALAAGAGPVGRATACALVCGMGHRRAAQRSHAAEALLALGGELPAPDLGWAIAEMGRAGLVRLDRLASALAEAVRRGAHALVWSALAAALPPLLPERDARPREGLAELIAVAAEAAPAVTGTAPIPGLAEIARRPGSSRVVREARRLHALTA